ncbi:uncharacterized protein METZ01_LOCUS489934, partial [marine metagenome]
RLLASQGWLQREILKDGEEIDFKLTDKGRTALALAHHYDLFCQYIPTLIKIDHYLFDSGVQEKEFSSLIIKLKKLSNKHRDSQTPAWEITRHIEGLLAGPILVTLGMSEFFTDIMEKRDAIDNKIMDDFPFIKSVIDFFTMLKWVENKRFTNEGQFFLKRAVAYGVTVSYLPTFMQSAELLFGNPNKLWKRTSEGLETHVNRRMNVWGSGGAHALYFRKIDEIVIDLFNQPLNNQPVG